MRYMCLVYVEDETFKDFTEEDNRRLDADNIAYDAELQKRGHYVMASPLRPPKDAVTVRVRNGQLSMTDGPFAETKEHLGGFIILEARDLNEALSIASNDPMAKLASLEVRPMMAIGERA
jgi:hypothetical protein